MSDPNTLEKLAGLGRPIKSIFLASGWHPRSGLAFRLAGISMVPLSAVAVRLLNRQHSVLGVEFNVEVVVRALKDAGRELKEC